MTDPIDRIEWLPAKDLRANFWNPNVVFEQELVLLERSILATGWIQPILISRDNLIIDGYHRHRLSLESKALHKRYGGLVPCARLDIDEAEAMMTTVRINRAKGTHVAVRMCELVKRLLDEHGLDRQQVANGIGALVEEVDLLYQDDLFERKSLKDYRYSRAWVPAEEKRARKRA